MAEGLTVEKILEAQRILKGNEGMPLNQTQTRMIAVLGEKEYVRLDMIKFFERELGDVKQKQIIVEFDRLIAKGEIIKAGVVYRRKVQSTFVLKNMRGARQRGN